MILEYELCQFSVGYSLQGKPTVGITLRNFREVVTAVEEPLDCPNVSRIGCKYAEVFQNFLQTSSFSIWNRMNNTGFLASTNSPRRKDVGQEC
ncbi:hypothetical protein L6452_18909 [Arctium lappa]|uniref:Uncharacterized protein n=1 Tax=Arctium lappa TaxID=4217 RepID=A0ACB9B7J8_ARCLA|nr:hypothetical protein L6452_18909 [Arctium lappa]